MTEIAEGALPEGKFELYGYSNHASGRYAEAHENVQLKLKSLRILCMGNSHTVDYTQFVENVLKDIDQDVATKITVERLTPMGGRGLTIDQGITLLLRIIAKIANIRTIEKLLRRHGMLL